MEGFLSTSADEKFAKNFINNALLEITVVNEQSKSDDYGFAAIDEISAFPQEKEILFNCLNVFKVKSHSTR